MWTLSYECIDNYMYVDQYSGMYKVKRITANLPSELLKEATQVTQMGITETLVQGLLLVKRTRAFQKAQSLKGQLNLKIDLEVSRERSRR